MIHSEMTGILDRPQRRIEATWDAGELGQAALAYADTLPNLARYLTGYDKDADDLVQETYARALQGSWTTPSSIVSGRSSPPRSRQHS
jgi:DNA-directed RNA polymerase specialized sigma24 family protein